MAKILSIDSIIQDVLDNTVRTERPQIGLNYVIYGVTGVSGIRVVASSCNEKYLEKLLERFAGPCETVNEQLELWNKLLPKIHAALTSLDEDLVQTGQGENVRAVFDVDMGGFFYNRISTHALLFGATLDQAQINNGRCDREMQQMVSEIQAVFTAHGV
jgi:hypothetical protein